MSRALSTRKVTAFVAYVPEAWASLGRDPRGPMLIVAYGGGQSIMRQEHCSPEEWAWATRRVAWLRFAPRESAVEVLRRMADMRGVVSPRHFCDNAAGWLFANQRIADLDRDLKRGI
jgi:hypothetical protein